ncbi:hypothetical protein, partial [Chryseobacterium sp. SIMBA_029]|uniref:hypothetical protein n=1 Tax=Chryseobacterium sp. SIMBA_029 TaxID=3085772 RepID=UPI00397B9B2A
SSGVPEQGSGLNPESVAETVVPAVTLPQFMSGFTVRFTAAAQSSLAGGGGIVLNFTSVQPDDSPPVPTELTLR